MSGFSMANYINGKLWIFISLQIAGLALAVWPTSVFAALLKDIRIGEYDGFTRVVFELDRPIASPHIKIQASGQLLVTFDNTNADLVRKIPFKRSRHIDDVLLLQQKEKLSSVLIFDHGNIRFETFPLSSPPRIAVDVFPSKVEVNSAFNGQPPPVEPGPLMDTGIQSRQGPSPHPIHQGDKEKAIAPAGLSSKQARAASDESTADATLPSTPHLRPSEGNGDQVGAPEASVEHHPNRLQFFLVIMLVIITIVILVMLFIMLLVRSRMPDEKSSLRTSEYLQHQDRKIAALNSRIKEQFKRYEDA